jgi:hypothetical protein
VQYPEIHVIKTNVVIPTPQPPPPMKNESMEPKNTLRVRPPRNKINPTIDPPA